MPRVAAILFATSLLACAVPGECQTGRQVKVVLEFQQQVLAPALFDITRLDFFAAG